MSRDDRRCACGAKVSLVTRDTGGSATDKHRRKTGCSSPGAHSTLFSRHCVVCGRGM